MHMQDLSDLWAGEMNDMEETLANAIQELQRIVARQAETIRAQGVEIACLKDRLMDVGILKEARQ